MINNVIVVDFLASFQHPDADIGCSERAESELIEKISSGIFNFSFLLFGTS